MICCNGVVSDIGDDRKAGIWDLLREVMLTYEKIDRPCSGLRFRMVIIVT